MPVNLNIKRKLCARSERVKCVDFHQQLPWMICSLYNGTINIWDYQKEEAIKTFDICKEPIRCVRFISREQWFICGSDDFNVRIYNYNTMDKVTQFKAHRDYIRYIDIHPTEPLFISCSDDFLIKLWDWSKEFVCVREFDSHTHFVMMALFNPKDPSVFASASLDHTIKFWSIGMSTPRFQLNGHTKGVNCIAFYPHGDKPYIASGSDDRTIRIWDYQTKSYINILEGHLDNVVSLQYHNKIPILISGSEDDTIRIWHSLTYRLESTLNYQLQRNWTIGVSEINNYVALGYDEGSLILKLGSDKPLITMEPSGRIIWINHNDVFIGNTTSIVDSASDLEKLIVPFKELGKIEIYALYAQYNATGHFFFIQGESEYNIYTGRSLKSKCYGNSTCTVWCSTGTGNYAIVDGNQVKCFVDFKQSITISPQLSIETIFGGPLLGVYGDKCLCFYDWENGKLLRKIDTEVKHIYWSDGGVYVALCTSDNLYILKYDSNVVQSRINEADEEGIDESFELLYEFGEKVKSGFWINNVFLYTNSKCLNYVIGDQILNLCHLNHSYYLLSYLPKFNKIFLVDKSCNVITYTLLSTMLEYQSLIFDKDFESANNILPLIPTKHYNDLAKFLESQGFLLEAYEIVQDPDHKFSLAIDLNKLNDAKNMINNNIFNEDIVDKNNKWKQICDLALLQGELDLATSCAEETKDYNTMLLIYSSLNDADKLRKLGQISLTDKHFNTSFTCYYLIGDTQNCLNVLLANGKFAEACMFAKSNSLVIEDEMIEKWKSSLDSNIEITISQ